MSTCASLPLARVSCSPKVPMTPWVPHCCQGLRPETCPDHSCPPSNKPFIETCTLPSAPVWGLWASRGGIAAPMCPGKCPNGCHCLPGRPSRAQAQSQPFRAEGDVCLGRCSLYHWPCLREQPNPSGGRALFSLQVCLPVFLNLLPTFKN